MGVLQADQPGSRKVYIITTNGSLDVLQPHGAIRLVGDGMRLYPAESRHAPGLVKKRMGLITQDYLFSPGAMSKYAHQVAHRPARDQECRFLSHLIGGHLLKAIR